MSTIKETKTVEASKSRSKKQPVQWKPSSLLDSLHGTDDDNFVYRWCRDEEGNLKKKRAEGWNFVNNSEGDSVEHERPGNIADGHEQTRSNVTYRDLVLMRMPKDMAEARKEYYSKKTDEQIDGLKDTLNNSKDPGVFSGSITVGGKLGARVID